MMLPEHKYPIGGYAPGNYYCTCYECGKNFFGDKKAIQCEPCAITNQDRYNAMTEQEKADHDKRTADAMRDVLKSFNL